MRIPFSASLATLALATFALAQPALACRNAMAEAPTLGSSEPFSPHLLLPAVFLVLTLAASAFLAWHLSRPAASA